MPEEEDDSSCPPTPSSSCPPTPSSTATTQTDSNDKIKWHSNPLAEANFFDRKYSFDRRLSETLSETGVATISAVRASGGYLRSACSILFKLLLATVILIFFIIFYLNLLSGPSGSRPPYPSSPIITEIAEAGIGSPLYQLLKAKGLTSVDVTDHQFLEKISARSYVEYRSQVISETVFPVEEKNRLVSYVREQLLREQRQGNELFSMEHVSRVLSMLHNLPESSVLVSLDNGKASLRNTAVITLLRVHAGRIYFSMSAAVLEAHLGFLGWIPAHERSAWNRGLSQMADFIAKDHLTKDLMPRSSSAGHTAGAKVFARTFDKGQSFVEEVVSDHLEDVVSDSGKLLQHEILTNLEIFSNGIDPFHC